MCGRIEFYIEKIKDLEAYYGVELEHDSVVQGFHYPRYNIPPTTHHPLVTSDRPEELVIGHWGYLPAWATERKTKMHELINARAESVYEKPFFKGSIQHRRCLIPVTGFFEWHREGARKTPYRFYRDGEKVFSIGGIYTVTKDEKGGEMPHWAILTTEANSLMSPVHDRMPVVIEEKYEKEWIDGGLEPEEVQKFFEPVKSNYLKKYQISTLVNSPKNDTPQILEPVK
jgi:putative SOS response-associated peptidase YedK